MCVKKTKLGLLFFVFILFYSVLGMATKSEAKDLYTTMVDQRKQMDIKLYLGQSITLSDIPEGELIIEHDELISVTKRTTIKAEKKGTTQIWVKTKEATVLVARIDVVENERLSGLTFDEHSFSAKIVGTGVFSLPVDAFTGMDCEWSTDTPQCISVNQDGTILPLHAGDARVHVKVVDQYGGKYEFTIPLTILEPHFESSKINLAKGCQTRLALVDQSGNPVQYKTMNESVVSLVSFDSTGVVILAKAKGQTTITASVDGVQFECQISVTNPVLKTVYGFYQKKKGFSLHLSGLNDASVPVWSSSDDKVARVSQKGRVSTRSYGSSTIRCQVDGKTIEYYVAVSKKTAVRAMRIGYKKIGKKKYSQARRMSKNYYDCSSFVYRTYRSAGKYLVEKTGWAPVAADIAKYYVRKKKYVKASGVYNEKKLRPGDLVCFGGSRASRNGRYKRIYHIAMYIGNGKTMESSSTYNNVVIRDRGTLKKKDIPVVVRPC